MKNNRELHIFCDMLQLAYDEVSKINKTLYVRTHDVRLKLGISRELMEKRLNEIWKAQFEDNFSFPYILTVECELRPVENWRLRKQKILIDNIPANIMQFHSKSKAA